MRPSLSIFGSVPKNIFSTPTSARFLLSSPTPESLPQESQNEFLFIGRANVGKSSLLNAIMGRTDLAKTSSKAGHTRALNFFQIGSGPGQLTLVDAPGYGDRGRPEWGKVFEHYITTRQSLRRIFLLINAKHGALDSDRNMLQELDDKFAATAGLSFTYQVVLTKLDSVPVSRLSSTVTEVTRVVHQTAPTVTPHIIATSASRGNKLGIQELRETIVQTCN